MADLTRRRAHREGRRSHADGAASRPLGRGDRTLADRPMVLRRPRAGRPGADGGRRWTHPVRAPPMGEHVLRLDAQDPALVHLPATLVGSPDPGLVRAGWGGLCRRDRGGSASARRLEKYGERSSCAATRTCSTPGFPRRYGRSRRSGWPEPTRELARYYPTDVLVTGFDIIFFWVARMMMMGLHFMQRCAVPHRLHPCAGARRPGPEDVEIARQHHRSAGADRPLWLRCAAFHAGGPGGAGPGHQALREPGRGVPQLRDQAVECGALCADERLRARARLSPRQNAG